MEREEKRKTRREEEKRLEEERQMQLKIALEERKILIAQRKLETIRLLSEVFNRIKVRRIKIIFCFSKDRILNFSVEPYEIF